MRPVRVSLFTGQGVQMHYVLEALRMEEQDCIRAVKLEQLRRAARKATGQVS